MMSGMRKWVVAGLVALVGVGVGVYLFWPQKKGTVEYHKRKYEEAYAVGVVGKWIDSSGPKQRRIGFHLKALLEAGYVERREFVVSNRPAHAIGLVVDVDFAGIPCFTHVGSNRIEVLARGSEMGRWESVIRKADVPESGK
jgi:hypothetical protein